MKLPAGLSDNSLEVFFDGTELKAIMNGNTVNYIELPTVLREPFQVEIIKNTKAIKILHDHFGKYNADEMEEQYVKCRYGALNSDPDLNDGIITPDLPVCSQIDSCPGYGIICMAAQGPGGKLSKREYQIAILVGKGRQDKEIAGELDIEITTLRTYLARIRQKLAINNRIEIALWAHKKAIV